MAEWFRSEYVKCGKAGCRKCPHGPYWYAYWREAGKMRKRYVGKVDPKKGEEPDPREEIWNPRKATLVLAFSILGLSLGSSLASASARFRELSREHHPDRGGSQREMSIINSAYAYVRSTLSPPDRSR